MMMVMKLSYLSSLAALAGGLVNAQGQVEQAPLSSDGGVSYDCHNACTALTQVLGAKAFYKSFPDDFTSSYYTNQQRETIPACVVRPTSAGEVSSVLKTIRDYGCHFAVKSGGHARSKGASNADGGITIDLVGIDGIELSEDRGTTRVGTGARWGKVYEVMEPQNLTVIGGRTSGVGVGGYLLGGGISFLSRQYGWAMDNVRDFEIVLANGSISNANPETNPDLYWALRGGGSNFGIITHFDLETYPQSEVWGGNNMFIFSDVVHRQAALGITRPFAPSRFWVTQTLGRYVQKLACLLRFCNEVTTFLQATEHLAVERRGVEPHAQNYMSIGCLPAFDICIGSAFLIHSKAVVDPPSFSDIKALKSITSTNRVTNISSLAKELDKFNYPGIRHFWEAVTLKVDAKLLSKVFDIFLEEIEAVKHVPGVLPSFVLQPISQIALAGNTKNGGNPLDITEADGSLLMLSIAPSWNNAEDDEAIHAAFKRFLDRAVALGKDMGLYHPFIYQNYASSFQDVAAGYGEKNRKRLAGIQQKYDPEGMLSRLQPGIFRL